MSEFEKDLKEKLDELANSVDCFDKISKRAYTKESNKYIEDDYTVCSTENITGKRKKKRFYPFIAAASAAAVLAVAIIPENSFVDYIGAKISSLENKKACFKQLCEELEYELGDFDYIYFDYSLSDYNASSFFINPLYVYEFPDENADNVFVRAYTKVYKDRNGQNIPTNQIYLVEYQDEYKESNILNIVDSKAKFNHDDMNEVFKVPEDVLVADATDLVLDTFSKSNDGLIMYNDMLVTAADYSYESIYKLNETIYALSSNVLYYNFNNAPYYSYYLNSQYIENGRIVNFDDTLLSDCWNTSVDECDGVEKEPNANSFFTLANKGDDGKLVIDDIATASVAKAKSVENNSQVVIGNTENDKVSFEIRVPDCANDLYVYSACGMDSSNQKITYNSDNAKLDNFSFTFIEFVEKSSSPEISYDSDIYSDGFQEYDYESGYDSRLNELNNLYEIYNENLERISFELSEKKDYLSSLYGDDDETVAEMQRVQAEIDALDQQLSELNNFYELYNRELEEINTQISEKKDYLASLYGDDDETIAEMHRVQAVIDILDQRLSEINDKITVVGNDLNSFQQFESYNY